MERSIAENAGGMARIQATPLLESGHPLHKRIVRDGGVHGHRLRSTAGSAALSLKICPPPMITLSRSVQFWVPVSPITYGFAVPVSLMIVLSWAMESYASITVLGS